MNVRADGDVNVSDMAVYDVYGKIITVVETVCTPSLQAQIDVSNLSAGMYFIRITTDHGTITKPFVKR